MPRESVDDKMPEIVEALARKSPLLLPSGQRGTAPLSFRQREGNVVLGVLGYALAVAFQTQKTMEVTL